MKALKQMVVNSINGLYTSLKRFPMTVFNLVGIATLMFIWIGINDSPPLWQEKLCYTFLVGTLIGMVAQFVVERLTLCSGKRGRVYGGAALLQIGYFLLLLPATEIGWFITIRSLVATFAMGCMVLWLPAYKTKVDFNRVTLMHFKGAFTALLYGGVLSLGMLAILAAIDSLLISVNSDVYGYMLTGVWVLFAPTYYLALLPVFKDDEEIEYPKFLNILVSKIAIPLVTVYTLVLIAYFLKIVFTRTWPSGQVGMMVLVYVIAGLLVYVLSGMLDNKFAVFYHKCFPIALIPIVGMQLISVAIRLKSYGMTESRYYVLVFGLFSLSVGIVLSLRKKSNNEWLALVVALIAIVSITPPLDAFTTSRNSQVGRIEAFLRDEGMLEGDTLIKKEDVAQEAKEEITNILNYLQRRGYLESIKWLPKGFSTYDDMASVFGFEPTYESTDAWYFYGYIDEKEPIPIEGYDVLLQAYINDRDVPTEIEHVTFNKDGKAYTLQSSPLPSGDIYLAVLDAEGKEVIGSNLNDWIDELIKEKSDKELLKVDEVSYEVEKEGYKLKVIFKSIDYSYRSEADTYLNYGLYVLFETPEINDK